jgi:hypothetical protein
MPNNPPVVFVVLTAVVMKIRTTIFWNTVPCIPPKRRFIYRLPGAVAQKMVTFNPPVSTNLLFSSAPTRE